jgi:hypothetical protein
MGPDDSDEPTFDTTQDAPITQTDQVIPMDCDEKIKPKVGQLFDTLEDAESFYKNYAHSVGFSVRCSSENKNKNGVKRWKYFVCSKEGYKPNEAKDGEGEHTQTVIKTKRRSLTREGCDAKVAFKLIEGGKYELARFHESHTHALASPSKRPFLRSARKVNPVHKHTNYYQNNLVVIKMSGAHRGIYKIV